MRQAACFFCAIVLCIGLRAQQQSESYLKAQVARNPQGFTANYELGEFYVHQHELRAGVPFLRKAYELNPGAYENAYDLGLAELELGNISEAKTVVTESLLRADRPALHNLLGDVEEASGNPTEAARQFQIAARMDPSEKNVFDFADELLSHRDYQQALQIFSYGAQKYPRSVRLRVGLGVAEYAQGRYTEAVETLCQAVDLDPKDTRALDFLGKMYDVSPQMADEVMQRLKRFVQLYPDSASANYYLAVSLRKRVILGAHSGEERQVEHLLLKAIRVNPRYADARYQLGLLYEDEDRIPEAIREYEAAIQLRPDFRAAHYHLARLYAKQGNVALSQKEYSAVQELEKRDATEASRRSP